MIKDKYATYRNQREFENVVDELKLLAMNLFSWEGLPESIDVDYLEDKLHEKGFVIGFIDGTKGKLILEGSAMGQVNIYNKPTKYRVYGIGYQKQVNATDVVVIKNNNRKMSTYSLIYEYAAKISDVQRTIDVLLNAHKMPYFIVSEEKQVNSIKIAIGKIKNNEEYVIGDKGLGIEGIKVLKSDAPFIIDKLWDYKRGLKAEIKMMLGLDSIAIDKKERLLVDEANANNQEISLYYDTMLFARLKAAEELSKLFDATVLVIPNVIDLSGTEDDFDET